MAKQCPKCKAGGAPPWAQCNGACPILGSPYYRPEQQRKYGGLVDVPQAPGSS